MPSEFGCRVEARKVEYDCPPDPKPREDGKHKSPQNHIPTVGVYSRVLYAEAVYCPEARVAVKELSLSYHQMSYVYVICTYHLTMITLAVVPEQQGSMLAFLPECS